MSYGNFKDLLEKRRVLADECGELTDKTVFVNRVSKVVKGGRRFSFSALIVTGDGRGHVGIGFGKAAEVPDAIRKASDQARKNLIKVPIKGTTIPFDVLGKFGPTSIIMKPGSPGTGVIAGSAVRAVMDVIGIRDIRTKCIGSTNPQNVLQATIAGLLLCEEPEYVASMRGMDISQIGYQPY